METLQLKCPNCGASIAFKADRQMFVCDFCDSEFTEEEINSANSGVNLEKETAEPENNPENDFGEHTNLYICESCGAEIVADENTAATFCHYCHGAVTLKGRVSGALQPELIIPFKINKDLAETTFKNWCAKKWFLPKSFKSQAQLEKMAGLYVPFWLADCEVDVSANFEARNVHSYRAGDYMITHTKIYDVQRAAKMEYRGVPADGSKKLDDRLMDAVEPFDYKEFVPFSMNWFSGFYADKYDVDKASALVRIKQRMEQGAQQVLASSVKGYTSVSARNKNLKILRTDWHYAMLPVWFMTYIYAGKKYFFAINGQTGKVAGIPPISIKKLIIMAACIIAAVGAIGAFVAGGLI